MTNPAPARKIGAVVIGGSAGSVDVLSTLLPAFSTTCGVAILVVVHLPRERPSGLPPLFGPKCQLTVVEAEDKQPLAPGVIYVAPPDYHLLVEKDETLALSADELVHYSRPSIDVLFESAADAYGSALLGVVLSGANDDGAVGLSAIARGGGLTLVQAPQEAVAEAMPRAALKAVPQSSVLSVAGMAELFGTIHAGVCPQHALAPRVSS
jgi:two-component system, chemotaxis family, protein-glutamate methylesterase/glutaminase